MITSRNITNGEAPPSRRIAGHLYRSLENSLTKLCAAHYDAGVLIRCLSFKTGTPAINHDAGVVSELRMKVVCQGLAQLRISLRVTALGASNFEVRCTVDDGDLCQLIYRAEDCSNDVDLGISHLGESLASFLLKEFDARIGLPG